MENSLDFDRNTGGLMKTMGAEKCGRNGIISRATALVPPTPLMGGMAVERKEHGDRIQK
jgi:hypothetical protein